MLKMSRQKRITAFFCVKNGNHVQSVHTSESVNSAASAEPEDLDEDNSIQTSTADVTKPTLAKTRKLKDHQGNSIAEFQSKFIIWPSRSLSLGYSYQFYQFSIVALDRLIFIFVFEPIHSGFFKET